MKFQVKLVMPCLYWGQIIQVFTKDAVVFALGYVSVDGLEYPQILYASYDYS